MKTPKYITVHSIEALNNRAEISFVVCNIPNTEEKRRKVKEIYNDPDTWFMQYHDFKYDVTAVKR
jgi:hypothetical protein